MSYTHAYKKYTYRISSLHRCELSRISRYSEMKKRADGEKKKESDRERSPVAWFVVIASCVYSVPSSRPSLALETSLTTCQYASSRCFPMGDTWWPCTASRRLNLRSNASSLSLSLSRSLVRSSARACSAGCFEKESSRVPSGRRLLADASRFAETDTHVASSLGYFRGTREREERGFVFWDCLNNFSNIRSKRFHLNPISRFESGDFLRMEQLLLNECKL